MANERDDGTEMTVEEDLKCPECRRYPNIKSLRVSHEGAVYVTTRCKCGTDEAVWPIYQLQEEAKLMREEHMKGLKRRRSTSRRRRRAHLVELAARAALDISTLVPVNVYEM